MIPLEAMTRARRHVRAASTLYRDGLMPECHTEMCRALAATLSAWTPALGTRAAETTDAAAPADRTAPADAAAPAAATEHPALAALASRGYDVARLRAVLAAGRSDTSDASDSALPRGFETTWAETERLVRFSTRQLRSPAERRRRRFVALGAFGLAFVVVLLVCLRLWGRVRARASATYSPELPASYAVDGIDTTEWTLPDGQLGWLDVYLPRPTDIRKVTVLNGHNRFYLDRASRRLRLTAYDGDRELASAETEFPGIRDGRSARDVKLRAQGATRVRVEVLSFYGAGGTLAEVEVH